MSIRRVAMVGLGVLFLLCRMGRACVAVGSLRRLSWCTMPTLSDRSRL